MECNKSSLIEIKQPWKAPKIVDRGQHLSVRPVIYTLETEIKRLIRETDFHYTSLILAKKPYPSEAPPDNQLYE
jgi:hypothetical protein